MSPGDDLDRALADVDAIRRRVINVVGHALRTPVTTMAGMAAALEAADDEETRSVLVAGLARNAKRVEMLLDDLLVAAGVSTALPVGEPRPVDVHGVVRSAWEHLGGAEALVIEGPAPSTTIVEDAFARIVHEVLDNAAKYGDGSVRVTVVAGASRTCIEICSIGDTPSDEEIRHAFELLYRGEHAVMASPGLGIGLPVARALARAHGADVLLERRGNEVVATIDLPA